MAIDWNDYPDIPCKCGFDDVSFPHKCVEKREEKMNCICEKHKDELKSLSLRQLGLKINENIQIMGGMYELFKGIINPLEALKERLRKDWPKENIEFYRIEEFIEGQIRHQQKIIDLLIEELGNRE
jgi:hypothetical protein